MTPDFEKPFDGPFEEWLLEARFPGGLPRDPAREAYMAGAREASRRACTIFAYRSGLAVGRLYNEVMGLPDPDGGSGR